MLRFEIALAQEAVPEFDAVFRLFVETLAASGDPQIHQVAFPVSGGERRTVMFESEIHRSAFVAVWEAVEGEAGRALSDETLEHGAARAAFAPRRRPDRGQEAIAALA